MSTTTPSPYGRNTRSGARVRRTAAIALSLLTVLGVGACADDEEPAGPESSNPAITPQVGEPAVVESTPPGPDGSTSTSTTVAAPAPAGAPDPEAAAAALYSAWKAGDQAAAKVVAEQVAVEGIFAAAPGDYSLYNRCNTGEFGSSTCLYRGGPGTIQFSMSQMGESWVVTTAIFSPA